ncbi:MAG TPA: hypothetical protein VMW69_07310, partial [Spirochaetia bacterium]|nr:hypothetical protein [Spirochaetia bacterium]
SLGVMLYEMLTGKRPFAGSFTAEALRAIQRGRYQKPRRLNPSITGFASRMIRKAMRSKQTRRYQDVGAILKGLDRRFGSRPVGAQKPEIARFLAGSWEPPKRRSRLRIAAAATAAVIVLFGAGVVAYGFRSGRAYEMLEPSRYGRLRLMVRVTGEATPGRDVRIGAELYRDEGKELSRVQGTPISFRVDRNQSTRETTVYVGPSLYLPAGEYRLKVASEGQLVWRGFYLESHQRQLAAGDQSMGGTLVVSIGKGVNLPVSVSIAVASAADGATIAEGTAVELYSKGNWLPFMGELASSLRSGNSYQFRFAHEGYYTTEYKVSVEPFQSSLRVEASLIPDPGALDLSADLGGVTITLNGAGSYRNWSRSPSAAEIPRIGRQASLLRLAPGTYALHAQSGSLQGSETLRVLPLKTLVLKIVSDRQSGKLTLESGGYRDAPELRR